MDKDKLYKIGISIIETDTGTDLSLNTGQASKLLVLKKMHEAELINDLEYRIRSEKIIKSINFLLGKSEDESFGLFLGLSGIVLALRHNGIQNDLYNNTVSRLINHVTLLQDDFSITEVSFELINGLSGLGKVLINDSHFSVEAIEQLAKFIIKHFSNIRETIKNKKEPHFLYSGECVGIKDNMIYDLGISHGVCGVLSLLTDLYLSPTVMKSSIQSDIKKLIVEILTLFEELKIEGNNLVFWPDFLEYKNNCEKGRHISITWCRGMIGISSTIHKAYLAIDNTEKAMNIRQNLLKIYKNLNNLVWEDAECFCHGLTALLYFFNKYNVLYDVEKAFPKYLFGRTLLKESLKNNYSMLDGIIGEYLVYLCLITNGVEWDYIWGM